MAINCGYDVSGCDCGSTTFPATGQTSCYIDNAPVSCATIYGQDGQVQAGAPLAYHDNDDGTITDLNTGLMWEKKSDGGGLHDVDITRPWSSTCSISGLECQRDVHCPKVGPLIQFCVEDTIFDWIVQVNAEGGSGFAGYSDWRVPNVKELQSIINYENYGPAVLPAFNNGCTPACTTCSCTVSFYYWSSTTYADGPGYAWDVDFDYGSVGADYKFSSSYVRAVRGGS